MTEIAVHLKCAAAYTAIRRGKGVFIYAQADRVFPVLYCSGDYDRVINRKHPFLCSFDPAAPFDRIQFIHVLIRKRREPEKKNALSCGAFSIV